MQRDHIKFYLNGELQVVKGADAFLTLSDYLRYKKFLTGTKVVCAEGDCGACTILKAHPKPGAQEKVSFASINSCIGLVAQMDSSFLLTVEGLNNSEQEHPVQTCMIKSNGSQCGYCTPGFVMAMAAMFERTKDIDERITKNYLTGNLCRCTGYQPIIDASLEVAASPAAKNLFGQFSKKYLSKKVLTELRAWQKEDISIEHDNKTFYSPSSLKSFFKKTRNFRVLGATTDLGVLNNKGRIELLSLISLQHIPELYEIKVVDGRVRVGARVTLSELRRFLEKKTQIRLAEFFDLFASPQIKNVATLAGNVANASPIADTPPFLLALNATQTLISSKGSRNCSLEDFYLSYKKTLLKPNEIIGSIEFDLPAPTDFIKFYKTSQRKDLDISTVNMALYVSRSSKKPTVRLALGGVADKPLRLKSFEKLYKKEPNNIDGLIQAVQSEIQPLSDLRGSQGYRRVLIENILRSFLRDVQTT